VARLPSLPCVGDGLDITEDDEHHCSEELRINGVEGDEEKDG